VIGREDDQGGAVEAICRELGLPVVVKPIAEGSSFGVSLPKREAELARDLAALVAQYGKALVEAYIAGTELTVGVVGVGERLQALPVLELVPHNEVLRLRGQVYQGLTDLIAPAGLARRPRPRRSGWP